MTEQYCASAMPPLVSAIMPAFNASATIDGAIRSVLAQTETSWELIVVDDGSQDDTLAVATRATAGDARVRIIQSDHQGRGRARNICVDQIRGRYVAICDADDLSFPDRFAAQAQVLRDNAAISVVSPSRVIAFVDSTRELFVISSAADERALRRRFARGRMPVQFAGAMLRASLFADGQRFDPELHRNQDFGFLSSNWEQTRYSLIAASPILYRCRSRIAPYSLVRENNYYRYYANRRRSGETQSADVVRSTVSGRLYESTVVPAQYAWYVARELARRIKSDPVTPAERTVALELLSAYEPTLSAGSRSPQ